MSKLTIITPTYNRGHLLSNLYRSLCEQSNYDFQWLIIDDGSTDNTEEMVSLFESDRFQIDYIKKENGGKHTALNQSHSFIKGRFIVIVDSDDRLIPEAVDIILNYWDKYETDMKIGGISFLKGYSENAPMTKAFPDEETVSNFIDYRINAGVRGDCCETVRTEWFVRFKFPVYEGEVFMPEGSLWQKIGEKSDMAFVNQIIYVGDYLENGLTKRGRSVRIQNPNGMMYDSRICFECRRVKFSRRMKGAWLLVAYSRFAKKTLKSILQASKCPLLLAVNIPFGLLLYLYWRCRYSEKKDCGRKGSCI